MLAKARDVMAKKFHTLRPNMTVAEAITWFKKAADVEGSKVFGMAVTDDSGQLVGMLSMYDILPFLRPSNIPNWEEMDDVEVDRLLDILCSRIKATLVRDIMTAGVISVSPDTHVMKILDVMLRRHIRRTPVVDGKKIVGMVYISDIFNHLGNKLTSR
jgi:CBS domain-containing protein